MDPISREAVLAPSEASAGFEEFFRAEFERLKGEGGGMEDEGFSALLFMLHPSDYTGTLTVFMISRRTASASSLRRIAEE